MTKELETLGTLIELRTLIGAMESSLKGTAAMLKADPDAMIGFKLSYRQKEGECILQMLKAAESIILEAHPPVVIGERVCAKCGAKGKSNFAFVPKDIGKIYGTWGVQCKSCGLIMDNV